MAALRINKRQLKKELNALRPYSRSQLAQSRHDRLELNRQMTASTLDWLKPYLLPDWQAWAEEVVSNDLQQTPPALESSIVLGMDIPLLQRFAAEVPEQCGSGNLYVHSLSDTQALVFNDSGDCFEALLEQGQIAHWQRSEQQTTEFETQLRAEDATALFSAWQQFAQEINYPSNLGQFIADVFDAGLGKQRLVHIAAIFLDWMAPYENIHTQCLWFNGVSRIMDGAEILHTMGHGRD